MFLTSAVTWLMALHLIFTYGPKAVDIANGVQQFAQHRQVAKGNALQGHHRKH